MDSNIPTNKKNKLPFGIKPLNSFQKRLSFYIVINLIIIIASIVFIQSISKKIINSSNMILAFKEKQTSVNVLMEYIAKLETNNKLVESDFNKYQDLLIELDDLSAIKKQIVDIGIKNKVDPFFNILTLNPSKEKEQMSYGFDLSMSGAFDKIIKTFKDINALPILITFDHINLKKNTPKQTERSFTSSTINNNSSTTTKTTIRRTTTTKANDIFEISVIGKIYLKETVKNEINESNQ